MTFAKIVSCQDASDKTLTPAESWHETTINFTLSASLSLPYVSLVVRVLSSTAEYHKYNISTLLYM